MLDWLRLKLGDKSPLTGRQSQLLEMVIAYADEAGAQNSWNIKPKSLKAGSAILGLESADQVVIIGLILRCFVREFERSRRPGGGAIFSGGSGVRIQALQTLLSQLLRRNLPYETGDLVSLLKTANDNWKFFIWYKPHKAILGAIDRHYKTGKLPPELLPHIKKTHRLAGGGMFEYAEHRELQRRAELLLGTGKSSALTQDFAWSRHLLTELTALPFDQRRAWDELMAHALTASASRPSKKWLTQAAQHLEKVSQQSFLEFLKSCVTGIQSEPIAQYPLVDDNNATAVKGLVWMSSLIPPELIARDIKLLAIYCFRKVPNIGAVSTRVGNACVYVLGQLPGLDSVAMLNELNFKIKYPSAKKLIDKALDEAADRNGMSRQDLEELSVPGYELDENGQLHRELGAYTALLSVESTRKVALAWQKDDTGKLQKTVPSAIKSSHAEQIRELRKTAKDIQATLSSQVSRIENLYLHDRCWNYPEWLGRMIEHPLVGHIARKLIWQLEADGETLLAIWSGNRLVGVNAVELASPAETAIVKLWHPIHSTAEQVMYWRQFLMDHEITQPFKQAHREVYVLTDAERETNQYSNRFAAHVLKQHQLSAICQQRGWRYTLQGNFDSINSPTLELPDIGLKSEFWVDGIRSSENNSGIFNYLTSDQVRFSRGAELLPLDEIDPIVFSEVMRTVDLFVSVCSIGNDPQWHDGGIAGYNQYWEDYSFGDLGVSAQTRREVLEQLVPKLKIADQCRIEDRFLVVQGKWRTYHIHLGSGNILMEPNSQYLCIVEGRSGKSPTDKLFLPFEGDHLMAVILSKAFLLADDDRIKDKTILGQIKRLG